MDTIAGVNAATTTITMGGNYSITAEFHEILAPTDWLLVGGITAVVVVVGLLAFLFVRRRRRAA